MWSPNERVNAIYTFTSCAQTRFDPSIDVNIEHFIFAHEGPLCDAIEMRAHSPRHYSAALFLSAVREPRGEVLVGCFEFVEVELRAILVLQHRPRVCRRRSLCQAHQLVGPATQNALVTTTQDSLLEARNEDDSM